MATAAADVLITGANASALASRLPTKDTVALATASVESPSPAANPRRESLSHEGGGASGANGGGAGGVPQDAPMPLDPDAGVEHANCNASVVRLTAVDS